MPQRIFQKILVKEHFQVSLITIIMKEYTKGMNKIKINEIYSHLLKAFLLNIITYPLMTFIVLIIGVGSESFLKVIIPISLITVSLLAVLAFIYNLLIKKIHVIMNENRKDNDSVNFAVQLPLKANLILAIVLVVLSVLISLI